MKGIVVKLAEYMVSRGITQGEAAKILKVTPATMHNWVYGKVTPSGIHMMQIYKWSNQRVTLKDWCEVFDAKA